MAAGALGSVSNRLRHENGDTHVVICDDVFSDAGSTPAASTISRRKCLDSLDRKSFIHSGLRFVSRIETFAGCGQLSRRLQYFSKFGDMLIVSRVTFRRNPWVFLLADSEFPRRSRSLQKSEGGIRPNSEFGARQKVRCPPPPLLRSAPSRQPFGRRPRNRIRFTVPPSRAYGVP